MSKAYRNPIALAREWLVFLESGEYSSAADLALKVCVSWVRVSQVLRLLRLPPEVLDRIVALEDPIPWTVLTERKLRKMANMTQVQQKRWSEIKLAGSP